MAAIVTPPRSPYWAALMPVLALLAGIVRWLVQGSDNMYTAWTRRYYVPDSLLGFRVVHDGPMWLGLDILVVLFAITISVLAATWWIRRRQTAGRTSWMRAAVWVAALASVVVPAWAWTTGLGPDTARDRLPMVEGGMEAAPAGVSGSLAGVPKGRYRVIPGQGSSITARIVAGGESFDTRFTEHIDGIVILEPQRLDRGLDAWVRANAASVDTGVTIRSKHAREYLQVQAFPELRFTLAELLASRQGDSPHAVDFWARGAIDMMGQTTQVVVKGRARVIDAAGRERLDIAGPALLITADFALDLHDTALAGDAGDFDNTEIPIHVSVILAHDTSERNGAEAQAIQP